MPAKTGMPKADPSVAAENNVAFTFTKMVSCPAAITFGRRA
jgi:hypothetical protein